MLHLHLRPTTGIHIQSLLRSHHGGWAKFQHLRLRSVVGAGHRIHGHQLITQTLPQTVVKPRFLHPNWSKTETKGMVLVIISKQASQTQETEHCEGPVLQSCLLCNCKLRHVRVCRLHRIHEGHGHGTVVNIRNPSCFGVQGESDHWRNLHLDLQVLHGDYPKLALTLSINAAPQAAGHLQAWALFHSQQKEGRQSIGKLFQTLASKMRSHLKPLSKHQLSSHRFC